MAYILLCIFVSVLFSFWLLPNIISISLKKNLFDGTNERKIHQGVALRLGGLSFVPAIVLSVALTCGVGLLEGNENILLLDLRHASFGVCSLILIYVCGIVDDLMTVGYRKKLALQILSVAMLLLSGVWVTDFGGILGMEEVPDFAGLLLTALWVLAVINGINFIDGINGLASGISIVGFAVAGALLYAEERLTISVLLSAAAAGTAFSFFCFNMFGAERYRSQIFMGDSGSQSLGLLLAYCTINLVTADRGAGGNVDPVVLMAAVSIVLLPLLDEVTVVCLRLWKRVSPFQADMNHIHHRLMRLGFSANKVLVVLLVAHIYIILFNVLLVNVVDVNIVLLADVTQWLLAQWFIAVRAKYSNK